MFLFTVAFTFLLGEEKLWFLVETLPPKISISLPIWFAAPQDPVQV